MINPNLFPFMKMSSIVDQVWPQLGPVSDTIAKRIFEPKINSVLKKLNVKSVTLESISNFKLKEFILGSNPARVGGIKAYDRNTDRDEVVMDVEIIYAGDARVKFSIQGMDCEINQVFTEKENSHQLLFRLVLF